MSYTIESDPGRVWSRRRLPGAAWLRDIAVLAALLACSSVAAAPPADRGPPQFAPGRLLVAPQDAGDDIEFHRAIGAHGGRSKGRLYGMDVHVVDVPPGLERDVAARLGRNPHVRFAEVDELVSFAATVDDPRYGSEWHLPKIAAPAAWDLSSGAGVTIAILDTGVDGSHPDLYDQMVPGWNFYDNNSNTADTHGHGTAVAGTAAARSNNALGVASVAGGARIMPVRIADPGGYAYWSTVAQGLNWAANHGARVANISYVGVSASSTVQSAASYFRSKGGVVVVCAGNTGSSSSTAPSGVMLVVAATNESDQRASFSTFGSFVDMAAPGSNIVTTGRGGVYQSWNGTSFASPIVAGAAALVIARRPDLSADQIEAALLLSTTDLGAAGYDIYFGAGRVHAAAAVQRAASMPLPTTDTTAPSVSIASPTGGTVSGTVTVSVAASDDTGVSKVELRVNGQPVASRTTAPWQFAWDSRSVANGSVTLSATAYDAKGNARTSAGVGVTVSNAVLADTIAPSLTITRPTAGSRLSNQTVITTAVSDNSGAAGITQLLYIDGALRSTVIGTPLSYKWNTRKEKAGTHVISVTARDRAGNSTTREVQVTK
jgi:subtilisin family serine protease